MKKIMLVCLGSLLISTAAFAHDVVLHEGQSLVICTSGEKADEVMLEMNQLLARKTIVVPGNENLSLVYVIQAPFTASAPSITSQNEKGHTLMCVTLTQN